MPEIPRGITAREFIRALHADGFRLTRTRGSHHIYRHADERRVVVAYHHLRDTFPIAEGHDCGRWVVRRRPSTPEAAVVSTSRMTQIEIRILTADDVEAYWHCRHEALERDPAAFSSSVEDHLKLSREEILRRLTADPANNFVFGVFVEGNLRGTAGFVRETQPKSRHKGRIWGVYLSAELRGQGLGRTMLQMVLDRAAKIEGLEQILLSVTTTQAAAIAVYRSLGFNSFGVEPNALKIGDRYVDEEYMILPLRR